MCSSDLGDPQLDQWVGVVNPRGEFAFNGRRNRFSIGYSGTLEAYERYEELTRYDQRGRLIFRHQATPRLQFRAQSSLSLSPSTDRLDDLPGLPFENVGTTQYDARGGFDYAPTRRSTMAADYNFQWVDFDRNSPTLIGRGGILNGGRSHAGTGSYRYAFTSRLSAGGAYSYRRAATDGDVQQIRVQDGIGMLTVRLTEHTTVEGGAGMAYLKVLSTGETRQGPSLRGRLAHSFDRVQVDVAYERTYVPSWTFGGTTTNEEARTSVRVPFARGRGFVSGGLTYRHNEPLVRSGDRIVLDSWHTNGTLGYEIGRAHV